MTLQQTIRHIEAVRDKVAMVRAAWEQDAELFALLGRAAESLDAALNKVEQRKSSSPSPLSSDHPET